MMLHEHVSWLLFNVALFNIGSYKCELTYQSNVILSTTIVL